MVIKIIAEKDWLIRHGKKDGWLVARNRMEKNITSRPTFSWPDKRNEMLIECIGTGVTKT